MLLRVVAAFRFGVQTPEAAMRLRTALRRLAAAAERGVVEVMQREQEVEMHTALGATPQQAAMMRQMTLPQLGQI